MYYNPKLNKTDLINRLLQLDSEVTLELFSIYNSLKDITKIKIVIAGSSSLILNNINIAATVDIDIINNTNDLIESKMIKYDMNTSAITFLNEFPYNYEDRLVKLDLKTHIIDYYVLSIEDALICKINANRGKDYEHIYNSNLLEVIDWEKLTVCAKEIHDSSMNNQAYYDFVHKYNMFCEEVNHEEAIIKDI